MNKTTGFILAIGISLLSTSAPAGIVAEIKTSAPIPSITLGGLTAPLQGEIALLTGLPANPLAVATAASDRALAPAPFCELAARSIALELVLDSHSYPRLQRSARESLDRAALGRARTAIHHDKGAMAVLEDAQRNLNDDLLAHFDPQTSPQGIKAALDALFQGPYRLAETGVEGRLREGIRRTHEGIELAHVEKMQVNRHLKLARTNPERFAEVVSPLSAGFATAKLTQALEQLESDLESNRRALWLKLKHLATLMSTNQSAGAR